MSTAQPIKNLDELEKLKNYYLDIQPNLRNYLLIHVGINTALRISDILSLKWNDVYNFQTKTFRKHIVLIEQKTGKESSIAKNQSLHHALHFYIQSLGIPKPEYYLIHGKTPTAPLSRSQAFRIIKQASNKLHLSGHISCHSLRKTFGYHAWTSGVSPIMLMVIYNHSSFAVTKRYLGIEQDDKDQVFLNINL
ncbi:tyrosine-type recombinase/integrase [Velocimicrobium porci]|uniref:Tyrosine-type recombinase/integrase n=1 Tax=Velocimicrobium porci TaxID=2606634 RepID=A0A6L5Y0J1_9FIRM|nr:tyrosine-type recombinase/integrase [Velocimicrobium porci]MSS64646.1 tyrosine-type recombinase/integrase [Velocimicrobium porci]